MCPDCNIGMNYHKDGNVHCHYCGNRHKADVKCDECGSEEIIKLGSGTQRVEEITGNSFNNFRIFRLDLDTSRKKGVVENFIDRMKKGEIDILLGTQMIAKGFDFPKVTVVGILLADIGLSLPDFRSSERIFSLLIQVAGRCGRGDKPGKVVLQTLNEENEIFRFIKNQDYYGFYKSELLMRKMLDYPPFSRIARLLVRGKNEKSVIESINILKEVLNKTIRKSRSPINLLGPSAAPFPKIARNYRYHIILKSKDVNQLKRLITSSRNAVSSKDTYLEIDIDPYDML